MQIQDKGEILSPTALLPIDARPQLQEGGPKSRLRLPGKHSEHLRAQVRSGGEWE